MAAAPLMTSRGAHKFANHATPRQAGEVARLRVLQGPDLGAVYVITGAQVTIGRGEENDVILSDLKASRRHAELVLTQNGWVARDLGSANGIEHNRNPVRQANLKNGESLGMGESTFEFITSDQATRMLTLAPKPLQQIQAEEMAFAQSRARVQALGVRSSQGVSSGKSLDPRLLVAALALIGGWYYFQDSGSVKTVTNKSGEGLPVAPRDLSAYLTPSSQDPVTERTIEMFFREGLREYRERNYLRARAQFESILQIRPTHALAKRYLANSNQSIEDEVKTQMQRGKKNFGAGKLRAARGNYEAVLRLLIRDQSNDLYKDAEEALNKTNAAINENRLPNVEGGAE